jgi:hypothetical protein
MPNDISPHESQLTISLVCLVGGIAHTVLADRIPLSKISLNLMVIYSVFEVVSDIVITGSLFYGLLKRKTGWMHTDRLIKRLARLLMETQTPPALRYVLYSDHFYITAATGFSG